MLSLLVQCLRCTSVIETFQLPCVWWQSCAYTTGTETKPTTCLECTNMGRAWQIGQCNPTRECTVSDAGCYRTPESCSDWEQAVKARELCPKQQNCSACVSANPDCGWLSQFSGPGAHCSMVADIWWGGNPDRYIRWDTAKCEGSSPQISLRTPQPGATQSRSVACAR